MNRKAFISIDTVISIFLLSVLVIITQNTSNSINRGYAVIYSQRQEIEEIDKLMGEISINDVSRYDYFWESYDYQNKIFKVRKIEDNKDFIKIEIKLAKDKSDEKIYEKIIFKQ